MGYRFEDFHPFTKRLAGRDNRISPPAYSFSYLPHSDGLGGTLYFPHANEQWPGQYECFRLSPGYCHLPWIQHVDGKRYYFTQDRQEIEIWGESHDVKFLSELHIYALRQVPEVPYVIKSHVNYGEFSGVYHEKTWLPPQEIHNPQWRGNGPKTRLCIGLQEKWRNPNGVWVLGGPDHYAYTLWYALGTGWRWVSEETGKPTIYMTNVWEW